MFRRATILRGEKLSHIIDFLAGIQPRWRMADEDSPIYDSMIRDFGSPWLDEDVHVLEVGSDE